MRRVIWTFATVLTLAAPTVSIPAQKISAAYTQADSDSPAQPQDETPVVSLELAKGKPVTGVQGAHAWISPVLCNAGGEVLMEIPSPFEIKNPGFVNPRFVAFGEKGGHSFSLSSIPDLYDVQVWSFFPGDSGVVMLASGTRDSKISDYTFTTDTGKSGSGKAYRGKHEHFLIVFKSSGEYESMFELPDGSSYFKVAEFPSGEFLLLAYNPLNNVVSLQRIDPSGKPIGPLQIPNGLLDDPQLQQGQNGDMRAQMMAAGNLGLWNFIPARGRVILYRPGAKASVLEVGEGGAVREVPISTPPGFQLDQFLPSTNRWIVRLRRENIPSGIGVAIDGRLEAHNYELAELNPSDGSLRSLLMIDRGGYSDVLCEADGRLISFATDDASNFLLSFTDIPK